MTGKHTEHDFISQVRNAFESSVLELDGDTSSDLAAIRTYALARRPAPSRRWLLVPAGAIIFIGLAIMICNILFFPPSSPSSVHNDIELMAIQEGLDLYDDIEFYEWLVDYEFPT